MYYEDKYGYNISMKWLYYGYKPMEYKISPQYISIYGYKTLIMGIFYNPLVWLIDRIFVSGDMLSINQTNGYNML